MTVATVLSRSQQGLDAPLVRVEVHVGAGLPAFSIVGLPETVVKESKDRVRAALANCGFELPAGHITVSLAPADLPKEGGRFDLPIAIGILVASGQLPAAPFADAELYGELSLGGDLHAIRGALPTALHGTRAGRALLLPRGNLAEAGLVQDGRIFGAAHLLDVCRHARGIEPLVAATRPEWSDRRPAGPDLADVRGQASAKRALEIAAAGEHSLLFMGPPGAGKSMLAQRLPGILPPMTEDEALETAAVRSLATSVFRLGDWRRRPFRSPHHTASAIALVGGGSRPRPGEISLAHNGVLFLDELPEFDRSVLEVLREPLESGRVSISRAARQASFPARFQLVAAMNPCPCGNAGEPDGACRCSATMVQRHRARISGAIVDRIDLSVRVPFVPAERRLASPPALAFAAVRARVAEVQARSRARNDCGSNAELPPARIAGVARLGGTARDWLARAIDRLRLSLRAHHRLLRVARTLADLEGADAVELPHLVRALAWREPERGDDGAPVSATAAVPAAAPPRRSTP